MKFRSVEDAFERLIELEEGDGQVQAIDYARRRQTVCRRCGGGPRTRIATNTVKEFAKRRFLDVCSTCYNPRHPQPWDGEELADPKERQKVSRSTRPSNARLEEAGTLAQAFSTLTLWQRRVLRVWVLWSKRRIDTLSPALAALDWPERRDDQVAFTCSLLWPRAAIGWSRHSVRKVIEEARDRVRPRLVARQLMDRGVTWEGSSGARRSRVDSGSRSAGLRS